MHDTMTPEESEKMVKAQRMTFRGRERTAPPTAGTRKVPAAIWFDKQKRLSTDGRRRRRTHPSGLRRVLHAGVLR